MKEHLRVGLGWLFITAVVICVLQWAYQTWGVSQPIEFNHKKHADWGMACDSCHVGAKEDIKATIPNVSVCAFCHVSGKQTPPTPKELEEYIQEMREIPWKSIYKAPKHVRFSHKRHMEIGGLDCKSCHGDVGKMERALRKQSVELQMARCMACHRKEKVTTDCLACHR